MIPASPAAVSPSAETVPASAAAISLSADMAPAPPAVLSLSPEMAPRVFRRHFPVPGNGSRVRRRQIFVQRREIFVQRRRIFVPRRGVPARPKLRFSRRPPTLSTPSSADPPTPPFRWLFRAKLRHLNDAPTLDRVARVRTFFDAFSTGVITRQAALFHTARMGAIRFSTGRALAAVGGSARGSRASRVVPTRRTRALPGFAAMARGGLALACGGAGGVICG